MASTNRASGEAKLLLALGAVVLVGGGALLGLTRLEGGTGNGPLPGPTPTPTPIVKTKDEFDAIFKKARHIEGPANAPVTLIEFADFECPSCRRAYQNVLKQMKAAKSVRIAFFHLPLQMHEYAVPAALAAEAAAKQGKFWEMYGNLFEGPETNPDLTDPALEKAARAAGLDIARFQKDLKNPALLANIEQDKAAATNYHIDSTPTFYARGANGEVRMGVGAGQLLDTLKAVGVNVPSGAVPSPVAAQTSASVAP